jgi:hypothetical protein
MADVYQYPGVTSFVEAAARDAGGAVDALARGARMQPALGTVDRVAGVLAERVRDGGQAQIDSPEGFRRATEDLFNHAHAARAELAIALAAADAILAEVWDRLGLDETAPLERSEPETPPPPPAGPTEPEAPPVELAAPTEVEPSEVEPSEPRPIEMMGFEVEPNPAPAPFAPGTGESDPDPADGTDPGPTGRRHRRRRGEG